MISKSNCNNIILFVHEKWRFLADMNAKYYFVTCRNIFHCHCTTFAYFQGSNQYFRYFLMLTLKDFYFTAFSIFGNSTPVSMDFYTKFNFCSVHMCLNPRKSLKTKKNALNFQKLIFNKKPDFLVI